ncbi:MAG: hypothetical protein BGO67_04945 [Alphaproteobacteria bacterium 41-28]|nr:MAG: hypothetical protein BGO67_04945 [Alphaproteobacteria bacterium 41-28]
MYQKKLCHILSYTFISSFLINCQLNAGMGEGLEEASSSKGVRIGSTLKLSKDSESLEREERFVPTVSLNQSPQENDEDEEGWVLTPFKILPPPNMDIEEIAQMDFRQKRAWEGAGNWSLYPGTSGYRRQLIRRGVSKTVYTLWIISEPILLPAFMRGGVDFVLGKYTPIILEFAGDYAEKVTSAVSPLAKLDPTGLFRKFTRYSIRNIAKGEALRKLAKYAEYFEKFSIPALTSFARLLSCISSAGFKKGRQSSLITSDQEKSEALLDEGWTWMDQEEKADINLSQSLLSISPIAQAEFITNNTQQNEE